MEEYCAEYINMFGLFSGNDSDSGFVSLRDCLICSSMLSGAVAVKAITGQERKLLSLPSLANCCLKSFPLHQWSKILLEGDALC